MMKNIFYMVLVCFLLAGCLPDNSKSPSIENAEIIKVQLEDATLYIPEKDFHKLGKPTPGSDSILLNVMYPDMTPILEKPNDLWKKGEWYRNISILISRSPKPVSIEELTQHKIESLKASKFVGDENGLKHYTQPDGGIKDHWDVWTEYEDNKILSVITCSEKIIKAAVPQCIQHLRPLALSLRLSYDKRLLKDAKKIREKVLSLLESYKIEQTSKDYFEERLAV